MIYALIGSILIGVLGLLIGFVALAVAASNTASLKRLSVDFTGVITKLGARDNEVLKEACLFSQKHIDGRILEILQVIPSDRMPQA